ncbi:MAG: phage portal protein [Chloroflexota bacterium]
MSQEIVIDQPVVNKQQLILNKLNDLTVLFRRQALAGQLMYGDKRDIYDSMGWPKILTYDDFELMYKRFPISKRIVRLPASESWRKPPVIFDGTAKTHYTKEEKKSGVEAETTPFTEGLKWLIKKRKLWHYLERVDRLAGIGRYSVLLMGTGYGFLSEAVEVLRQPQDLAYLSTFGEKKAKIDKYETDQTNENYARPRTYTVDFGEGGGRQTVHHSRIIHVAEDLSEDEVYGESRLEAAYNILLCLLLVVGGTSEGAWRSAFGGLHADVSPDIEVKEGEEEDLEAQLDGFIHQFRRFLFTQGVDVNQLSSEVTDPTGLFKMLIGIVSGDIPQHMLLGSQAGELASSQQDARNWAGFIASRQTKFAEPMILRPFIDWCIDTGALPEPSDGEYDIEWPSLFELTDEQKAGIRKANAEAQEIEDRTNQTPIVKRWERMGDVDEMIEAWEDSQPYENHNFEPGVGL